MKNEFLKAIFSWSINYKVFGSIFIISIIAMQGCSIDYEGANYGGCFSTVNKKTTTLNSQQIKYINIKEGRLTHTPQPSTDITSYSSNNRANPNTNTKQYN